MLLVKKCIVITLAIFLAGLLFSGIFFGVQHESHKLKAFLVTLVIVLLFHFLFVDQLYFLLRALYATHPFLKGFAKTEASASTSELRPNRSEALKSKLATLKSQLYLQDKHCNESVNIYYRTICHELWLYCKFFVVLLILVIAAHDKLLYYNTRAIRNALEYRKGSENSLQHVHFLDDFYSFAQQIVVIGFHDDRNNAGGEPGWINSKLGKLLNVVRLRQHRVVDKKMGLGTPDYEKKSFMPRWELPFRDYRYTNKYWRIYDPWISNNETNINIDHDGILRNYPMHTGYSALLARNLQHSTTVLQFLRGLNWLDDKTAVVYVDFALFNVDANVFSICSIVVEQTFFGDLVAHMRVQSAELLLNLNQLSYTAMLVLLVYVLQFMQFCELYIVKVWHNPVVARALWNLLDLLIILLNISLVVVMVVREATVIRLLAHMEAVKKLEYVDFNIPGHMEKATTIILGLLVALTTLRIWRILQFAKVFRTFTRTLYTAKTALLSTTFIIFICVFSISLATSVVNGNFALTFVQTATSFMAAMSYSVGFNAKMRNELDYRGSVLIYCLFWVLAIVVTILMLNLFITLIIEYFKVAQEQEAADETFRSRLSFWEFLKVEYAWVLRCFQRTWRPCRKKQKPTITESFERALDDLHAEMPERQDEAVEMQDIERLELIGKILKTQADLLSHELDTLDQTNKTYDEEVNRGKRGKAHEEV